MATKVSELTAVSAATGDDIILIVDNVANSSSIESKKITVNNFFGSLGATGSNSVSASISGNTLTISLNAPVINKYMVTDAQVTSQLNAAPYTNTLVSTTTNATTTANASTLQLVFEGSITGNTSVNANGEPTITISSSHDTVIQNPEYNTARVKKLNFNTIATPSNSSYVNSTFEVKGGDVFYDASYIYVAVSNTEIKKVALSAF
jgi:hypothetical protein